MLLGTVLSVLEGLRFKNVDVMLSQNAAFEGMVPPKIICPMNWPLLFIEFGENPGLELNGVTVSARVSQIPMPVTNEETKTFPSSLISST